jgi:hypothetical protein
MTSGAVAALIAGLALAFVEGLRRFYPARATWRRIRSRHGRRAARAMRERFEAAAARRTPRLLALLLFVLVGAWVASASLLDKRWYEVVADVLPYVFVSIALLRMPPTLRAIADRMRGYENDVGEDPDRPLEEDEGPTALAI